MTKINLLARAAMTLLLALFCSVGTWADTTISTFDELKAFVASTVDNTYAGQTVTIANDINCGGQAFVTSASDQTIFSGTLDGGGHTISNFVNPSSMFWTAFNGAVIKDLTLAGTVNAEGSGLNYTAAFVLLAGRANALTMQNCHFTGSVTNYRSAAAFVGLADLGSDTEGTVLTMTGCTTTNATVTSTYTFASGGLVAVGTGVVATNCSYSGAVACMWTLGGLIGQATDCSFTGCSFNGTLTGGPNSITASDGGCGGLVGYADNSTFTDCSTGATINWVIYSSYDSGKGRINSQNFTAVGGAAGVTLGASKFTNCTAAGTVESKYGYVGGFVGWTAGAETFDHCTTSASINNTATYSNNIGDGGFAASVASNGAQFIDCYTSSQGKNIYGGFYNVQHPKKDVTIGPNTFLRCTVDNVPVYASNGVSGGFCVSAWNGTFTNCTVRGGKPNAGFVQYTGEAPTSSYSTSQTSTFTDCAVIGAEVALGFFAQANRSNAVDNINIFRRCRAACLYNQSSPYGGGCGFGSGMNAGTLVEDCAALGAQIGQYDLFGFAVDIVGKNADNKAVVRRCVAAALPLSSTEYYGGFADNIGYYTTVEDCYSVYGPRYATTRYNERGVQGGFLKRYSGGYQSVGDPITRCFALGIVPEGSDAQGSCGSFCGNVYNTSYQSFVDCYRPEASKVRDVGNIGDDAGIGALTAAQFSSATAATMPNYDFTNTWRAPNGVASSPYLAASTDADGNFWTFAAVISGEGSILINGEEPKEAYAPGSVITVEAVPNDPDIPFTGWVGDGYADPTARVTTYTVKNVSVIAATFGIPIRTCDDLVAIPENTTDAYALMNDLDFTDYDFQNDYNQLYPITNFMGRFFGQNHTIRGLEWKRGSWQKCNALFNSIYGGAEIRDLTVVSSSQPDGTNNIGYLAGLVGSVGNSSLIKNCHAVVDFHGSYPEWFYNNAKECNQYYGLIGSASGADIRIIDCTVRGTLVGGTEACGFIGSTSINGGEISRCAVFADVSVITNRTNGLAAGFASDISLDGGATLRECFAAGYAGSAPLSERISDVEGMDYYEGVRDATGFANTITFRDAASSMSDCYSTMEVKAGGSNYYSYGIASGISGNYDGDNNVIKNVWFGGTVRGGYQNYAFARDVDYATLTNCHYVTVDGVPMIGRDDVTALSPSDSRKAASWAGYDFKDVWSLTEDKTTPYFAWSLSEGKFNLLSMKEAGKTITHPATATPGSSPQISAETETDNDEFFLLWDGAAAYEDASAPETTFLADNHRYLNCIWGKAITTRAELAAIGTDENRSGTYGLGADIDLAGEAWTPLCQENNKPFTGSLYGRGYKIKNMNVEGTDSYAGLFGRLEGATVKGIVIDGASISGSSYIGAIAGYAQYQATISNCVVNGTTITTTGSNVGAILGSHYNSSLINNYYVDTTVKDKDSNVGCDGKDVDGARRVYTLALGDGIATARTGTAIGNGCTIYTNGFSGNSKEYYTANSEVTLTGAPGFKISNVVYTPEGEDAANATDGGNGIWLFNMPAKNVSVTATKEALPTLTITADSGTKEYDGTALTKNSFTSTGLAEGDHIESVTITGSQTSVGESDNMPSAAVIKNASNEDVTANYNITYVNGTLTVTAKTVNSPTIVSSETYCLHDGQEKKPAVTVKDGETTISADEYTVSYSNNTNVGTATVTITDKEGGNYTVSGTGTFEIRAMGDANVDKVVNAADIVEMVNAKKGQPSAKFKLKFADFDGNRQITDEDIDEVVKKIMGNE